MFLACVQKYLQITLYLFPLFVINYNNINNNNNTDDDDDDDD